MKISIYANFADMLIDVHGLNQMIIFIKKEKHFLIGMEMYGAKQFVFLVGSKDRLEASKATVPIGPGTATVLSLVSRSRNTRI